MATRFKPFMKRGSSGVTRIVRDTYGTSKNDSWWTIRAEVVARDKGKCFYCKVEQDPRNGIHHECHHIRPLSRGGTTSMSNLMLVCKTCHEKKHKHLR